MRKRGFAMERQQEIKENKMGVMPVGKLLLNMSLPMMISMLVMALYNVVDSMFVSRISENALTALSMAFPVQNLMVAVAAGLGVGLNAVLSRALGAKEHENVRRGATSGLFMLLVCALVFMLGGMTVVRAYFEAQTDIGEIIECGVSYTSIVTIGSLGLFMQILCERLFQSTGRTVLTMIIQGLGAIINIILDPIMIFGYFGMPAMGVAGAALATIIGQWTAATLGMIMNAKLNKEVSLSLRGFCLHWPTIRRILAIGVPSVIMQSIGSVMTFAMNQILIAFSSTAVAVFGVYFKLQSFVFMPIFGMNNGMVPIVAYNYGARKPDRITKTIRLSITYALCIMLLGITIFQLVPGQLLKIFNASDTMLEIGIPALKIISIHFIVAGFSIVCTSAFQALGHGMISLVISVLRQLFVLLPSAYILSRLGGLDVIWWSFPIAEVVSALVCALFLRKLYKNEISAMK